MCSADSEEMTELVVKLLFSGGAQSGGGIAQDILDLFKRACSIPCRRVHTQVIDAIEKVKALPPQEFDDIVSRYFKKALGVGAVGLLMYGPQETGLAKLVLSVLERVAGTVSFERIIQNSIGSVMWTSQAVLPSAKIIVGIGLAKVIVNILIDIKREAVNELGSLDEVFTTAAGNTIVINAIRANTHFVREKIGPAVNAAKRLFTRNANVPMLANAPRNNRGRSRSRPRRGSLGLRIGMQNGRTRSRSRRRS